MSKASCTHRKLKNYNTITKKTTKVLLTDQLEFQQLYLVSVYKQALKKYKGFHRLHLYLLLSELCT